MVLRERQLDEGLPEGVAAACSRCLSSAERGDVPQDMNVTLVV
jgi:hypothetical protein